jgi:hypothetical protein
MRAQRPGNLLRNTVQIGEAQPDLVAQLAGETGNFLSVLSLPLVSSDRGDSAQAHQQGRRPDQNHTFCW